MGADKLAENTTDAPNCICPNCLPKPKVVGVPNVKVYLMPHPNEVSEGPDFYVYFLQNNRDLIIKTQITTHQN